METENPAVSSRPRPWLLAGLAVAVLVLVVTWMRPTNSATQALPASNQAGAARRQDQEKIDPADLHIRLEALSATRPAAGDVERNPFRFQPKAAPPPPPGGSQPSIPTLPTDPPTDPGPPPPPPIPLKFIGIVEKQGLKVAAMSDCRSTFYGTEGQIIDGRYRLIRIGVESLVIEYVDGRGRTTVRLDGCPAR